MLYKLHLKLHFDIQIFRNYICDNLKISKLLILLSFHQILPALEK